MYSIFCDGVCIYNDSNPDPQFKVISPKLKLADNASGSLTFSMPPSNAGYDVLQKLTSVITVYRDGKEVWEGRPIGEEGDFWNNRKITCEGELGYLNDTSQPPAEYHTQTVKGFLQTLLNIHNAKTDSKKQFKVGIVTVTDPNDSLYRYTNYESTLDCVLEKMVKRLGGHLRVRKENGIRYLDFLSDYPNTNTQTIEFGKNLIDFTKNWDATDLATVIVPLGAAQETRSIDALEEYLTVKSVNNESIYVVSEDAAKEYGWIEAVVHWDNVTTPEALLRKAAQYLSDIQFDNMILEVSAADLHNLNVNVEAIDLLDEVQCISVPHGMNRMFPVTEIDVPLDAPEDTVYVLGSSKQNTTLSAQIKSGNQEILSQIDQLPSEAYTLHTAKEQADAIMKSATNGFITTVVAEDDNGAHSESLVISNTQDWKKSTKYWLWNLNGLAHYDLTKSTLPNLALTMDGTIVAERVKTGILGDTKGTNYWNMETGEFRLSAAAKVTSSPNYRYGYVPTNQNYPASNWTTDDLKKAHLGETFYNYSTGKRYVWKKSANNVTGVAITFHSASYTENGCDWVDIYYQNGSGTWSYIRVMGSIGARTIYIPATDFYIWWRTDGSVTNWGWKINSVTAYSGNSFTAVTGTASALPLSSYTIRTLSNLPESDHQYGNNVSVEYCINTGLGNFSWVESSDTITDYIKEQVTDGVGDLDQSLSQEDVFNRLTNNGTLQGIYMDGGKLYINASYVATGILADPNKNTQFNLATGALTMNKGSINIAGIFKVDEYGNLTATSASISGTIKSGSTSSNYTEISSGTITNYNSSYHAELTGGQIILEHTNKRLNTSRVVLGVQELDYYYNNVHRTQIYFGSTYINIQSITSGAHVEIGESVYIGANDGSQVSVESGNGIFLGYSGGTRIGLTSKGVYCYARNDIAGFDMADGSDFWLHANYIYLDGRYGLKSWNPYGGYWGDGQTGDFWIKNSNGDAARFTFYNGIMVGYSGF